MWYSDDRGASYTLSATVMDNMDECTLAELEDGTVYLNMRNNHIDNYPNRTSCDCRAYALSTDGGATFGKVRFDPALISPVCQATLSTPTPGALLFANPANSGVGFSKARDHGTIKKSTDNGKSWSSELHVTPLGLPPNKGGSYDYSCLVPDAIHDDPSQGGLLWSHLDVGDRCDRNPAPTSCWLTLFSRFPLDF